MKLLLLFYFIPVFVGNFAASPFFIVPPRCAFNSMFNFLLASAAWFFIFQSTSNSFLIPIALLNVLSFFSSLFTNYVFTSMLKKISGITSIRSYSDLHRAAVVSAEKSPVIVSVFFTEEWISGLAMKAASE